MNRVPVVSSNVAEVGYDPEAKILEVAFIKGGVYQYLDIPSSVHAGLLGARSVGQYLNVYVKKVGYRVRKIAD